MSETVADPLTSFPGSRAEADAWLLERARRVVHAHLSTREDADFARSVKSMIDKTVYEYGGRFLYELIQNGYDRNDPNGMDGRLAVLLTETEAEHGVLYVANTGCGFTTSNVRSIANLGLSDKEVGDGIGNKGVGFKSVLQICDSPEIYSTLPTGDPGFCFRFARDSDVPDLVDHDRAAVRHVLDEMSLYSITVPADGTPERVARLWAEGYSSVVRLPLRKDAASLVTDRLAELTDAETRVLLFLRRLCEVSIRREGSQDIALRRTQKASSSLPASVGATLVTLDAAEQFRVFTREVPRRAVATAVKAAIESHRLDPKWQESTAAVEVSVAVAVAAPEPTTGRFYTYLPLGAKAPSPFAGHLNAPFATNLARIDVDPTNPLNALLLSTAADLCLDAADALRTHPDAETNSVLDLVCWDKLWIDVLSSAAARSGIPLAERHLLPTNQAGRWATMTAARRWPEPHAVVLTASLAATSCGIPFLPELGAGRARRLDATLQSLGLTADPDDDELANWVETMLGELLKWKGPIKEWDQAYADIAQLFQHEPSALRSRRILLTDDWELRRCANVGRTGDTGTSRDATPFFPPARQRVDEEDDIDPDADLELPRSLTRRLFYVHSGLTWYVNRQQTPARTFLQNNRLVRRFDTRSIFDHLRSVLASTRSVAVYRDALRLAYNLDRSGAANKITLSDLGLRVPNSTGIWILTTDALFSAGWSGTSGRDLSLIAATPADRSAELAALHAKLLQDPELLLGKSDSSQTWADFLGRAGVSDILPLQMLTDERRINGRYLSAEQLAAAPGLPEAIRDQWRARLPKTSSAYYPDTPYKATSELTWLPGQADWPRLTAKVRDALCRQILNGLKRWDPSALVSRWERDRAGDKDGRTFATPLRAFLASAAWLPLQRPGQAEEEFVPPRGCWTFPSSGDETPPRFAALLAKRMRDLLRDDPTALRRLHQLGVGVWGSSEDAARLVAHLGALLADGAVPDIYLPQFRNLYQRAWSDCADQSDAVPFPADVASQLVVDIGGSLTTVDVLPADAGEPPLDVVVAAADDERSLLRLLADFRRPVLTVGTGADQVTAILKQRLGEQVVRATDIAPAVLVDGMEFVPAAAATAPLLADLLPMLPTLIATLLEFRRGTFSHIGQRAFEEALDATRRVRLVAAERVEVRIGDATRALPSRSRGVLSVPDPMHPALVVASGQKPLDWPTIDALAEPFTYLIGRPELATELRLAAARLQAGSAPVDAVDDIDIAAACEVAVEDVRATTHRIEASTTPLLERLYPVTAHLAGIPAAALFDPETSVLSTESDVRAALLSLGERLAADPHELLKLALDAVSVDALRRDLDLPLEDFNKTITMLGGRYQAIDYSPQHAEEFADHIRRIHERILDRIRWARWDRFTAYEAQPDWSELRRPTAFSPDPVWGLTRDSLSPPDLEGRVEAELQRLLGGAPPQDGPPLVPTKQCQKANAQQITTSASAITEVVRAWLGVLGEPTSSPWSEPETAASVLLERLDRAGALDFEVLGTEQLLRWLYKLQLWPEGMPLSSEPGELGLTRQDLEAQRSEETQRRAAAARARRTVYLDDQPFDLEKGVAEFRSALDLSVAATPDFLKASRRFASLGEAPTGSGGRGSSGGGPSGSTRQPRMSDTQRDAIGFAGEWLAYKWLEQLHGDDFSSECWVSAYRQLAFPGKGDDALGWDFAVPTREGLRMYEVKSTQGEGGQIELGETQVLAAQQNARNGRWRLLVITDVLSDKREIRMLRNPFDPRARGQYAFVGQGLRLRFTLG